jgi:hypothetical protein
MLGNLFYGWFDDPHQTEPTYDPPHDGPCPICGHSISHDDVRTHSLLFYGEYAARSYFYRTHRSCAESDKADDVIGFISNMVRHNGD